MKLDLRKWGMLAGILLMGAVLRFVNLNELPIFADESIYVRWSQVMRAESSLRFLPLTDGKQPLFMWITIPFFKIFQDPLIAGRVESALTGLGTILGIYALTELLFANRKISLLAAGLAAIMPYLIFFDRMSLADSMLSMFMVWTGFFSLLSLKKMRWDFSMVAGFTLGFAWLTKSPAMFMLGLLPFGLLFSQLNWRTVGYLLTTYIIGFGMYNILRLGPEFQMIAIRNKDYVFSLSEVLHHPTDPFESHLRDSLTFYSYLLTPVGLLLALWGILKDKFQFARQKIVLGAWFLLPMLAESAIAKQYTARYILFTVPAAVILMAFALNKWKAWIWAILILPCVILDYLFLFNVQAAPMPRIERSGYLEEWTSGFGLSQVADYIKKIPGPIIVGSEGYFGTPFDALQLYLNQQSNVRIIGVGVWIDSVSPDLLNALKQNQVFLVVNSDRLHADPNKLGLKLISSYPKAVRPDGTRQSLLFFKVLPR